jgi:hypothetical protein
MRQLVLLLLSSTQLRLVLPEGLGLLLGLLLVLLGVKLAPRAAALPPALPTTLLHWTPPAASTQDTLR